MRSNSNCYFEPFLCIRLHLSWILLALKMFHLINCFSIFSLLADFFPALQKVTVIAMTVSTPVERRKLFAQINSFIAVFILVGQLTLTVWHFYMLLQKLFVIGF